MAMRMGWWVALYCCMALPSAAAAVGQPDPAFAGSGYVLLPLGVGDDATDTFTDMIVDADGAIVAIGYREDAGPGGNRDMVLTRLLEDGTPDPGFGTTGTVTVAFDLGGSNDDQGSGVFQTADGHLVGCGIAEGPGAGGGVGALAVVRLLPNGVRDTSFDLDGRRTIGLVHPVDGVITPAMTGRCAAGPDGTILVPGTLYNSGLTAAAAVLVRLKADGSLDTSLAGTGVLVFDPLPTPQSVSWLFDVQALADGRMVGVGIVHGGGSTLQYDMFAVRLLPDGSLDPSFGDDGVRVIAFDQGGDNHDLATSFVLDGEGGMYIAGSVSTAGGGLDVAMVHLLEDGSLDPGFATGGRALFGFDLGGHKDDRGNGLAMDRMGRLYVAGTTEVTPSDKALLVMRVTPTGQLDPSYASGGVFFSGGLAPPTDVEQGLALALDARERAVVVGQASGPDTSGIDALVMRLTSEPLFRDGFEAWR